MRKTTSRALTSVSVDHLSTERLIARGGTTVTHDRTIPGVLTEKEER